MRDRSRTYYDIGQDFSSARGIKRHPSIFVDGDTMYSYGYHYPMFRRYPTRSPLNGDKVFIGNSTKSTVTTNTQMRVVFSGIFGTIIMCTDCDVRNIHTDFKRNWGSQLSQLARGRATAVPQRLYQLTLLHKEYIENCAHLDCYPVVKPFHEMLADECEARLGLKEKIVKAKLEGF